MRKLLIGALAAFFACTLWVGVEAQTHDLGPGTHTIKLSLTATNGQSVGHDHTSQYAVKTPWISVPVMRDFMVVLEQASDSAAGFAGAGVDGDTVHVALETAPSLGLVVKDSLSSGTARHGAKIAFWWSDLNWSGFNTPFSSRYFNVSTADTVLGDAGTGAQGGVNNARGPFNLGMLRFSLCQDDADSLTDGAIAINCYIIYHEESNSPSAPSFGGLGGNATHFEWAYRENK